MAEASLRPKTRNIASEMLVVAPLAMDFKQWFCLSTGAIGIAEHGRAWLRPLSCRLTFELTGPLWRAGIWARLL